MSLLRGQSNEKWNLCSILLFLRTSTINFPLKYQIYYFKTLGKQLNLNYIFSSSDVAPGAFLPLHWKTSTFSLRKYWCSLGLLPMFEDFTDFRKLHYQLYASLFVKSSFFLLQLLLATSSAYSIYFLWWLFI